MRGRPRLQPVLASGRADPLKIEQLVALYTTTCQLSLKRQIDRGLAAMRAALAAFQSARGTHCEPKGISAQSLDRPEAAQTPTPDLGDSGGYPHPFSPRRNPDSDYSFVRS